LHRNKVLDLHPSAFSVIPKIPKRERPPKHARIKVKLDTVMGIAREMGRLIRLSYNGHLPINELTGYIYALDKTRACLESAIAIEANAAKSAPVKHPNINVSIVSIPSGHFIGAEGIARIESGAYQQLPGVVTRSVEDYISDADAQVGANRELNAGIATAADDHGIVPRSPEQAELLAKLSILTTEELAHRAGISLDDVEPD
jgi:hypothetical protein